jgi:hypothetical protein
VDADGAVLVEAERRQGTVVDRPVDGGRVQASSKATSLTLSHSRSCISVDIKIYVSRHIAGCVRGRDNPAVSPRHLPLDQARLRPHLRAGRGTGEPPVSAALSDVLEAEAELVRRRRRGRVVVPSPGSLRGLPAQGWGVAGVEPGTQPEQALLAKERRRVVDALEVRVAAAHELVDKGLLDGMLARRGCGRRNWSTPAGLGRRLPVRLEWRRRLCRRKSAKRHAPSDVLANPRRSRAVTALTPGSSR